MIQRSWRSGGRYPSPKKQRELEQRLMGRKRYRIAVSLDYSPCRKTKVIIL
jgi:hypothetical protein